MTHNPASVREIQLAKFRAQGTRIRRQIELDITTAGTLLFTQEPVSDQVERFILEGEQQVAALNRAIPRLDGIIDQIAEQSIGEEMTNFDAEIGDLTDLSLRADQLNSRLEAYIKHLRNKFNYGGSSSGSEQPVVSTPALSGLEQSFTRILENALAQGNNPGSSTGIASIPGTRNFVKLPKLEMKKFDGDLLKFQEFWDAFEVTIHINSTLQPVEKMNYLITQLTGDAKSVVAGLSVTNDNYPIAVALLLDRYGNKQAVLSALYSKLASLPSATNDTTSLRKFYDQLESTVRSLVSQNENVENQQFVSVIKTKLSHDVLLSLERSKGLGVQWTSDMLRRSLHLEISAREAVDRSKPSSSSSYNNSQTYRHKQERTNSRPEKGTAEALVGTQKIPNYKDPRIKKCIFCEGNHWSDECRRYSTVKVRKEIVKGRCFGCLATNHMLKDCRVTRPCVHCSAVGKHHRSLCIKKFGSPTNEGTFVGPEWNTEKASAEPKLELGSQGQAEEAQATSKDAALLASGQQVLLQTAKASVQKDVNSPTLEVKVLLDCGCNRSYITSSLANKLHLNKRVGDTISLNRFATGKTLNITTEERGAKITGTISRTPVNVDPSEFTIKGIKLADTLPLQHEDREVDFLIGSDYYLEIITGEKIRLQSGLWLLGSRLGWILTGKTSTTGDSVSTSEYGLLVCSKPFEAGGFSKFQNNTGSLVCNESVEDFNSPLHTLIKPELSLDPSFCVDPNLEPFWELETIGICDTHEDNDDSKALESFTKTVQIREGRYEVTWPYKEEKISELPDNFELAFGRLNSLIRKLSADRTLLEKYSEIIQDQEKKGIIEKIPFGQSSNDTMKHYIAHQAVITPMKTTTKVRIVYDASAKSKKSNLSLNDCLYRGPIYLPDLCGLLLRFRSYQIAIIADIEKAFLQVGLQAQERDVARFLWLKDPENPSTKDNLQIYRFCRVPFGMVSSPFLLGATVDHHLCQYKSFNTEMVRKNIYMDNVIIGAANCKEAEQMYQEIKRVFQDASMNLREWISNNMEFNDFLPPVDQASPTSLKVLGVSWDVKTDTIAILPIRQSYTSGVTKRNILKTIAQIYDPMGLFSAATITAKCFLQKLWERKLDWDEDLPFDLQEQWSKIFNEIEKIPLFKVPRCIGTSSAISGVSLICFCDASEKSYGAVVYLRIESSSGTRCNLIFSKNRLRPQRKVTIPRMELLAATVGVRCLNFVSAQLHKSITEKILFCDSQCVLKWIKSKKELSIFVKNRIKEIRNTKDICFRYVHTDENPADLASRGVSVTSLSSFWWEGPTWLRENIKDWPTWDIPQISPEILREVEAEEKKGCIIYEAGLTVPEILPHPPYNLELGKFSSYLRLIHVTAWCSRFLQKIRKQPSSSMSNLEPDEVEYAKKLWEFYIQRISYDDVTQCLKKGKRNQAISDLGLYLDENNIIRCKGRLENADLNFDAIRPKLLPRKSHYTKLVIDYYHKRLMHEGTNHTLAEVRHEYWIPQGRTEVRSVLKQCFTCRRWEGGPFKLPNSPQLPKERVTLSQPFSALGLDYFGPLNVKISSDSNRKVWICLFTCLAVRAIHLEVVEDLSAEQFLLAFRRFIARRGMPKEIISDNATQFKAST